MKNLLSGVIVLIIIVAIVSQCDSCGNSNYNSRSNMGYGEGYNNGYTQGYNEAKNEYQNSGHEDGYNKSKEEYQAKIDKLINDYEDKINETYNRGFAEGEVAMRDRIAEQIELNAQNKIRQGDWNAILFDPKD
jgi:flagellar biosynthesis/type III secretory pathway protein FliH